MNLPNWVKRNNDIEIYIKGIRKKEVEMTTNIGMILLAVFLILQALVYFGVAVPPLALGIVAVLAAVLILVGR